jgi:hypothetical protein
MIVNNEEVWIWKEIIMPYFKILSRRQTDENHKHVI